MTLSLFLVENLLKLSLSLLISGLLQVLFELFPSLEEVGQVTIIMRRHRPAVVTPPTRSLTVFPKVFLATTA